MPLMVMHSHCPSDHVARDSQFRNRHGVEFVAAEVEAVQRAFGIKKWPETIGLMGLAGRELDVIPIPGHHPIAVALYDWKTAVLMTGDNVYPGRLYISDWPSFVASTQRLVDFTQGRLISYMLGGHIEQTSTPYLEYTIGSIFQPEEHVLELSRGDLLELNGVLKDLKEPTRIALRSMTLYPIKEAVLTEMRRARQETESRQRQTMWSQPAPTNR